MSIRSLSDESVCSVRDENVTTPESIAAPTPRAPTPPPPLPTTIVAPPHTFKLGPWTCESTPLFSMNGTHIFSTTDPLWILKVNEGDANINKCLDELSNILRLRRRHHPHALQIPDDPFYMYGRTNKYGWYAMRRYSGNAAAQTCQWNYLARHVLEFLRVLHQTHHLVHMDIKLENILVERKGVEMSDNYVVADYDLMTVPSAFPLLRDLSVARDKWYYVMMGAYMDKPLQSYRMDLAALGFAVARLCWPVDMARPLFRRVCMLNRERVTDSIERVVIQRDTEMLDANSSVCAYFRLLDTLVPWSGDSTPPSNSVYDALAAVFP